MSALALLVVALVAWLVGFDVVAIVLLVLAIVAFVVGRASSSRW